MQLSHGPTQVYDQNCDLDSVLISYILFDNKHFESHYLELKSLYNRPIDESGINVSVL